MIQTGLQYLAEQQKADGHWENPGFGYTTATTALCGMALLMEGSTLQQGKYATHLRKAVDWLMEQSQGNGLIWDRRSNWEANRYMFGHGYGLMLLASVFGEEENGPRRRRLQDILARAVAFTARAQLRCGGWYYDAAQHDAEYDELCVTASQLQALRAAKSAGIAVPKAVIDKARAYLEQATTVRGSVVYSLSSTGGTPRASWHDCPSLTPVAIVSLFSAGDYSSPLARRWIASCRTNIHVGGEAPETKIWSFTHYYYAQVIYSLGDDGYARLFPNSRPDERLTWTNYRTAVFDYLASCQKADGSWENAYPPLALTASNLGILQLDNSAVPIYQR
jgi:hypothetical protein